MNLTAADFAKDVERINSIPLVKTLLDVICQSTGMGFAAIARVTQDRWVACCVRDDIQFGLVPGGELKIETTICNEIRGSHQPVVIDHVQENEAFCTHPTPLTYGFQSYISFPIVLKTGEFFGTLCAIDPQPAQLENEKIRGLFTLFSDLISLHLQQIMQLEESQQRMTELELARQQIKESEERYRNLATELEQQVQLRTQELQESVYNLQRSNANLEQFAYVASHDLQEPLRKIHAFSDILRTNHTNTLGADIDLLNRMQQAADRMSVQIKDLLIYSRIATQREDALPVSLDRVVQSALLDLELLIRETQALVEVSALPVVQGDGSQLEQLFINLLSNAVKFRRAGVQPHIQIKAQSIAASDLPASVKPLQNAEKYHQVDVRDNGIGFDAQYLDRIFLVFQRLHSKKEFEGTGIGLAICEKVAINHGGCITAVSQPGQGATFQVFFPALPKSSPS